MNELHPKRGRPFQPVAQRFWAKVKVTAGCWPWMAYRNSDGYGMFNLCGEPLYAHRVAWLLSVGPIPIGMEILHECDNRPCVRPDHTYLGTQLENMADCIARGRRANFAGELNPRAKLDVVRVLKLRELAIANGWPSMRHGMLVTLAETFGVSSRSAAKAISGETWAMVG